MGCGKPRGWGMQAGLRRGGPTGEVQQAGARGIGVGIALELARRGCDVTMLKKGPQVAALNEVTTN